MRSSMWRKLAQPEGAAARVAQWKRTSGGDLGSVVAVAAAAAVAAATNWSGRGGNAPLTRAEEGTPHTIPGTYKEQR